MRTTLAALWRFRPAFLSAQTGLCAANDEKLGRSFRNLCNRRPEAIQPGMLYQHSFLDRASQQHSRSLKADPGCGIAYWAALSLL